LGVKKFLETYQDIFIISSNHAYNPHVFVRSDVDKVEVATIEKGTSGEVMQAILKNSKLKTSGKKKKKPDESPNPSITNQAPVQSLAPNQSMLNPNIQDSRTKATGAIGDHYYFNDSPGMTNNNMTNNNIFPSGNYGSSSFLGSIAAANDKFGQSSFNQNAGLMKPRENDNADLIKSGYLFNSLSRGGLNYEMPPGLRPQKDKSPWDIYRSKPSNSDLGGQLSSSLDLNFFNNDFNTDFSHLMSGTSLSASSTATNNSNINNHSRNNNNGPNNGPNNGLNSNVNNNANNNSGLFNNFRF